MGGCASCVCRRISEFVLYIRPRRRLPPTLTGVQTYSLLRSSSGEQGTAGIEGVQVSVESRDCNNQIEAFDFRDGAPRSTSVYSTSTFLTPRSPQRYEGFSTSKLSVSSYSILTSSTPSSVRSCANYSVESSSSDCSPERHPTSPYTSPPTTAPTATCVAAGFRLRGGSRNILLYGHNKAGKTSLLYRLKLGSFILTVPTKGISKETLNIQLECGDWFLTFWDVGEKEASTSPAWRECHKLADRVIFIVDGSDRHQVHDVRSHLLSIFFEEHFERNKTKFLILVNKQDLPYATSASEVESCLQLPQNPPHRQRWRIMGCSAMSGVGLQEGLEWLLPPQPGEGDGVSDYGVRKPSKRKRLSERIADDVTTRGSAEILGKPGQWSLGTSPRASSGFQRTQVSETPLQ